MGQKATTHSCWIDFALGKDRLIEGRIAKTSECCMFALNPNVCIFLTKSKGVLFLFLLTHLKVSKFSLAIKSLVGNKDRARFFHRPGVASCGISITVTRVTDLWTRKGLNVTKFTLVLSIEDLNTKKKVCRELWAVLKNNGSLGNLHFYLNERGLVWEQGWKGGVWGDRQGNRGKGEKRE